MSIQRKIVDDNFSVSSQPTQEEIAELAAAGVRSLICNRPDGESNDQPTIEEIRDAAAALGLEVVHVPVVSGQFDDADIDAFAKAMDRLEAPVHAYCRTGTRSITMWSLVQQRRGVVVERLRGVRRRRKRRPRGRGRWRNRWGHGG